MKNLFKLEDHARLITGMALLGLGAAHASWLLIVAGVVLIYTGATRFCFVYYLLGINRSAMKDDYHLTLLPRHNPEPVYLFNRSGELVFRNNAASNILPGLDSIEALYASDDVTEYHQTGEDDMLLFRENGYCYALHFQHIPDKNLIAAYGFNVTKLLSANQEIINTQKELIFRMGEIGETRSRETGNHVKRVAEYSELLANLYGLSSEEAELMKMASPMHDIGKVAIPDAILLKPGKLEAEEWEIMKTHAAIGHDLLKTSERPILKAAAIVAGQHHEKWDGSGYPNGFAGEDIHIYGRITALADVFDALGSERVYKKAWPMNEVLEFIEDQKGKQFEPRLVELFQENLPRFIRIRDQYADDAQPVESVDGTFRQHIKRQSG